MLTVAPTIHAIDGADVEEVWNRKLLPEMLKSFEFNTQQARTDTRDRLGVK